MPEALKGIQPKERAEPLDLRQRSLIFLALVLLVANSEQMAWTVAE